MDIGDGHIFSLLDKKPVHAILLIFKPVKHQYNLQHLSYHYHHHNEHYINKFWQVRNLRLPFAKIWFWQVCSLVVFVCLLLLAKIWFLLLAKIWFWQVCSLVMFVCLFVCLCVCLFVRKFHKISRTAQSIITKLRCKQALVHDSCKFVGQECRSNN